MEVTILNRVIVISILSLFCQILNGREDNARFYKRITRTNKLLKFVKKYMEVESSGHCAMLCKNSPTCQSFAIQPSKRLCYLYQGRFYFGWQQVVENCEDQITYFWQLEGKCPEYDGYTEDPLTKICYKYKSEDVTWLEAKSRCEEEGGHLFMANTESKRQIMKSFIEKGSHFFLGASDQAEEGVWTWFDGEEVSQGWKDGEPNNKNNKQACLEYIIGKGLNDIDCSLNKYSFACEIPTKSAQFLNL